MSTNESGAERTTSPQKRAAGPLLSRVPTASVARGLGAKAARPANAPSAADSRVPEAAVSRNGAPVNVEITFGHAQHGQYTLQLFDAAGTTELTRETGLSTDGIPDRFELKLTPAQLDQHLLQWSGAVDAFSPAPGQQFSVIFDVTQSGQRVPGGHVEKVGPLVVTQAFLGILRLVAR
jgi:hypothetical protein